ncbi:hypothetical protein ACFSVN_03830, partial [Gracilimonas halophila]
MSYSFNSLWANNCTKYNHSFSAFLLILLVGKKSLRGRKTREAWGKKEEGDDLLYRYCSTIGAAGLNGRVRDG